MRNSFRKMAARRSRPPLFSSSLYHLPISLTTDDRFEDIPKSRIADDDDVEDPVISLLVDFSCSSSFPSNITVCCHEFAGRRVSQRFARAFTRNTHTHTESPVSGRDEEARRREARQEEGGEKVSLGTAPL